uniref:DNA-directed RNA polymerase subunit n=1 Tax=Syphacia muris TaxID=451379 RepID=A0A0N5AWC2_9BILA
MAVSVKMRPGLEPFMQLDRLQMRSYSSEEIEKLSVLQITQTEPYDNVGHPIRDGLCDLRLGPTELHDTCETCHQQAVYCPGHMGHIKLDVPVFNPILYSSMDISLMKGTCVHCHRLTCRSSRLAPKVLLAQLHALNMGMVSVAEELKVFVEQQLKTGVEILFCDFIFQFKNVKRCYLCTQRNATFRNDNDRCVLLDFSSGTDFRKRKAVQKKTVNGNFERPEDQLEEKKFSVDETNLSTLNDSPELVLQKQLLSVKNGFCTKLAWRAVEIQEHFRMLWKNEGHLLKKLFPLFDCELTNFQSQSVKCPLDILFCDTVLVPPNKFRPVKFFRNSEFQHPQTVNLKRLLEATETFRAIRLAVSGESGPGLMELIDTRVPGKTMPAKLHNAYLALQQRMNALFDQDLDRSLDQKNVIPGLRQILEKKQGLFRMNMMGKRVNYACRSVITPDPYLDVDEIGIPEVFAKKLTFADPVNAFNLAKLKKAVKNGPDVYPGANYVQKSFGQRQVLLRDKPDDRFAIAKRLQAADTSSLLPPVLRHLNKGDLMLMNRQPSLHKPSLMGHRARVIKGQRAMRLNYAPCKAYNADFDGDEMNGHFVQDLVSQAEVAEIANVGSNFLVPKDGTPLLGLIQDHVISAVRLTIRGRFFTREDFMHLVFAAFAETDQRLKLPPPTMIKPEVLWSGKQVISTIVINCIPNGKPLLNLTSKAKTPLSCWKVPGKASPTFNMSESEVIFRQAELLVGVLDKQHCGSTKYGLLHSCWELYGHRCAVKIMSCFSRLFTTYLQFHGFTLGVADILVCKDEDKERRKIIKELRRCGDDVVRECFDLPVDASQEEIKEAMANAYLNPRHDIQHVQQLDYRMKEKLNKFSEKITNLCVPSGLVRKFPNNALQTMILCGAKGTMVNSMQISCGLGQIELEGQRPPVTAAGRTLPSFSAFDTSPRAGGFVDQRFLTGMNPQELFFHTMAGREGLIDTAVKTSRSGYLQRCIVKHLEGLVVNYDSTVRDHDNSVIQFRYGEDGMDVCKCTFMNQQQFEFLSNNIDAVRHSVVPSGASDSHWGIKKSEKSYRKIKRWRKHNKNFMKKRYCSGFIEFSKKYIGCPKDEIVKKWFDLSSDERESFDSIAGKGCPQMVDEKLNSTRTLGALPEKMLDDLDDYISKKEKVDPNFASQSFRSAMFWKGLRSKVDPGENVGLLAAQSIGEPSTQMTLNTFHFAGRGEMNVTLGIPRLREILMTASDDIKTPSAEIRVKPGTSQQRIDKIKKELSRIYLKEVIKKVTVEECIHLDGSTSFRSYDVALEILSPSLRDPHTRHLKRRQILLEIERKFLRTIAKVIHDREREMLNYQAVQHKLVFTVYFLRNFFYILLLLQDELSSEDEGNNKDDADAGEVRLKQRHLDDAAEYEGEDDEKNVISLDYMKGKKIIISNFQLVVASSPVISKYSFDSKSNRWCIATFKLPLSTKTRLDVASLVEKELETFVLYETHGVEKCIQREENHNGEVVQVLATQGINIQAFFKHADVLDVNSIYSNDLSLICRNYGIEACTQALVKEIVRVFTPYGIDVNKRHLTLTADYMTFTGKIQPFNRGAMSTSPSPLQRMTFETTISFMREAIVNSEIDYLESPSARIVVGGLLHGGTGAFDLLVPSSYFLGRKIKEKPLTSF